MSLNASMLLNHCFLSLALGGKEIALVFSRRPYHPDADFRHIPTIVTPATIHPMGSP